MEQRKSFIDFVKNPPATWKGWLITILFGLAGGVVTSLLNLLIDKDPLRIILSGAIPLVILLVWYLIIQRRVRPLVLVPENQQPPKHKGLIVLVGTGRPGEDPMKQSAGTAIEYHLPVSPKAPGLKVCWLIATAGAQGSLPVAQALKTICESKKVTAYVRAVEDPWGLQDTHDMVQRIYEVEAPAAGLAEVEVISDFTGSVKPMSAGMILACGSRRPMQYMYGRKDGVASVPRLLQFSPRRRPTR